MQPANFTPEECSVEAKSETGPCESLNTNTLHGTQRHFRQEAVDTNPSGKSLFFL